LRENIDLKFLTASLHEPFLANETELKPNFQVNWTLITVLKFTSCHPTNSLGQHPLGIMSHSSFNDVQFKDFFLSNWDWNMITKSPYTTCIIQL